jgi:hypothetical protein
MANHLERSTAGTGAALSLSAIGKQDTFLLTSNVQETFWNANVPQHTNFSRQFRSHIIGRPINSPISWPFSQEIIFDIDPKTSGDLLANAFLKCTLPDIESIGLVGTEYASKVGQCLIKEISFLVDGVTIDKVEDIWIVMHDDLFLNDSESRTFSYIVGKRESTIVPKGEIELMIPLFLFFNRGNINLNRQVDYLTSDSFFKPYFYLCCCWHNKIQIKLKFHDVSFFSNVSPQDISKEKDISMPNLNLVTEEYYLTEVERTYLQNNKQISIHNSVQNQPSLQIPKGQTSIKTQLVCDMAVKSIHWAFRNTLFSEESNNIYYNSRFNFSSNTIISAPGAPPTIETGHEIMNTATIYISSDNQIGSGFNSDYYKYLQPFQHHLETPDKNIYSYSFAINPRNPIPTGSVNFSELNSAKTAFNLTIRSGGIDDVQSNSYDMYMYYLGYKFLKYENGFVTLVFS